MARIWLSGVIVLLFLSVSACSGMASNASYAVALGDFDRDGDLDAWLANGVDGSAPPTTLWINQGGRQGNSSGKFLVSTQEMVSRNSRSVVLGDLDGDGDLDAITGVESDLQVYLNQGQVQYRRVGEFAIQEQGFAPGEDTGFWKAALGDLDGDGDLDAYVVTCCAGNPAAQEGESWLPSSDLIFWNDGAGKFTDSGQRPGGLGAGAVALGDLDGDGDLDVYTATASASSQAPEDGETDQPDRVWLNDGSGSFSDSEQRLGGSPSTCLALGDLDADGDLDAFVPARGPALVWLNDGAGTFTDSGQRLGALHATTVSLGDLDGDGDLDAVIFAPEQVDVWLNDGHGRFELSGQQLRIPANHAAALGDLDGDGDLDVFAARLNKSYRVWWNDGFGRLGNRWR